MVKQLGLEMEGCDYSEEEIVEVLLAAAAKQTSIEQICKASEIAPSGNTVRGIIRDQLNLKKAEEKVNAAFAEKLPKRLKKKKRGHRTAIDLVLIPYHGQPDEKESEIVRSQAKSGTTHFHAYATAFIVERGKRFTLALTFVRSTDDLTEIIHRLQNRVKVLEIRVKCLLLDREFYTVEMIRDLKQQKQKFIIPVIIRGKKNPPGGSRVLVQGKTSYWTRSVDRNEW